MSQYHTRNTLYYIDALLKYSNYGKAAKALYISQPYLTQVIKRIEEQLSCEIINRRDLPYRLTEQGKIYYQYLTTLDNSYVKLLREISAASHVAESVLKIGVLPSLGSYLLPLFLPRFMQSHPACRVELYEDLPEINEHRTLKGELDFWIGQNSSNISPSIKTIMGGTNRYRAIIPRSSDLYQENISVIPEGSLEMDKLLSQRLILTSKGSAIRSQVDQLLNVYKIEPEIVIESAEIYTVQKFAVQNMGVTFVPESVSVKPSPKDYNIYPIPSETLNLDYFIAHHTDRDVSLMDEDLINAFVIHSNVAFAL